ncbi:MAG: hypothetical protein JHC26_00495 [Thermofilum sp.]|uniref:hypothetical protein n=1 Tax=Thermofilum sp. TaxID=1961369 RepID=UPI00258DE559|nr:hypothetical protein [Thermofilum sp.]MCI4407544.1 hypothetical protein [Thermofilum sp.]
MELELKWAIRKVKKEGKTLQVYYISIPSKVAQFLKDYKPYLDIEKKIIVFRKGEKNE